MKDIFVSYRIADSSDVTGRIFDQLKARFGEERLFRDVDSIPFGNDFRTAISEAVGQCKVLLVIIGNDWLDVVNDEGARRIDDPADYVHIEIASALERQIPVIPVLVENTDIPDQSDLPIPLEDLVFRNASLVRADPDFKNDIDRLCKQLEEHTGIKSKKRRYFLLAIFSFIAIVVAGIWGSGIVVNGSKDQKQRTIIVTAMQEFSRASYTFTSVIFDAYDDARNGKMKDNSKAIRDYQDDIDIEMDFALATLEREFAPTKDLTDNSRRNEFAQKIEQYRGVERELHEIIMREVGQQHPQEKDEEKYGPWSPDDATTFEKTRKTLKTLRDDLLSQLENMINNER